MIIWANFMKRLRMRRAFRETYFELSQLDDQVLRDINVMRGEIGLIAKKAAQQAA
jgi:uncharacterized protein YjiS (DUF1127 family)